MKHLRPVHAVAFQDVGLQVGDLLLRQRVRHSELEHLLFGHRSFRDRTVLQNPVDVVGERLWIAAVEFPVDRAEGRDRSSRGTG